LFDLKSICEMRSFTDKLYIHWFAFVNKEYLKRFCDLNRRGNAIIPEGELNEDRGLQL
jgi:hypothetical protein